MPPRPPGRGRITTSPAAQGELRWFAPAQGPQGWLVAGQTTRPWPATLPLAEARFEGAVLTGSLLTVFGDADSHGVHAFLALLHAPHPACGQLLELVVPAHPRLSGATACAAAGRAGRALLNGFPSAPATAALRASLPRPDFTGTDSLTALALPIRLVIDAVVQVPPDGIAIAGALFDPMRLVVRVGLRRGDALTPLDRTVWAELPRPNEATAERGAAPDASGFIAHAIPPSGPPPECLEIETRDGDVGHLPLSPPQPGASLSVIQQFLAVPRQPLARMAAVMTHTIGPIARGLNRARLAQRPASRRMEYGPPPVAPARSLIIPLHGRLDFMAMQLALFSARPDPGAEILYVLDDPQLWNEAERQAQSCLVRFGLPFSLIDLGANLGYAPANNAGIASARGHHLCLLNSDVFPAGNQGLSWLATLCGTLDDPGVGAAGALLLFEDGTVQHDGMEYRRIASLPPWPFPTHPGKGWLRDPSALARQDVAAVTGACLAVRRADLLALGGLDEELIIADFEDAALCEALRARSLRIVLRRDVQLHHLERQTPGSDTPWRFGATLANASHFAARWNPDAG